MKIKTLYLFAIIAATLSAQPVVKESRDLSPPVDWRKSELANETWWTALMAEFQPEKFTFQEWKKYHSESFISKLGITEEIFQRQAKSIAEKRDALNPVSEITRLVFITDGNDEFLRVEEVVQHSTDPKGSDTKRITFLKKTEDGWIIWTMPVDMPFGSPLQKVK